MTNFISSNELIKFIPGTVLASSNELDWKCVEFVKYQYKGQEAFVPAMQDYMIVSYKNGITPMRRRFEGRWTKTICKPGDASLLTRSQTAEWHWDKDVEVDHIYLSPTIVMEVASEVFDKSIDDVCLEDILSVNDPIITYSANLIFAEAQSINLGGKLYVETIARQLVVHLIRKYANVKFIEYTKRYSFTPSQKKTITEFINSNLEKAIDLNMLAGALNMGVCNFARHFKQSFGVSPYAFVIQKRLERACRLLTETRWSLKEISYMTGFSDQAHFSRVFKRCYKTTPAAFRRSQ